MGFQSVQMSRADFFESPSAVESPPKGEPFMLAAPERATPLVECEAGAPTDPLLASPGTSPDDGAPDSALADSAPLNTPAATVESPPKGEPFALSALDQATPLVGSETTASTESVLASPETSPDDGAPDGALAADSAPLNTPAAAPCCDASAVSTASPGAESPSSETLRTGGEDAKKADLIDVWRQEKSARSRRGAGRKTQFNRSRPPSGESLGIGTQGPPGDLGVKPLPAAERARNKNKHSAPSSTLASADARQAAPPPRADAADEIVSDEKRRQTAVNRDMPRSRSGQQPRAKVDPNSPFAKLLELRSLLVEQANKRP
jgi:hypothetical protein